MKRFSRGVTLIELLIGIAILVILTGIAVANVGRLLQKTKVQAAKSTMGGIGLALDMVKTDTGLYPAALGDIKEASAPSGFSPRNWRGPYAENISLTDPWGNQYEYSLDLESESEETPLFGPTTFQEEPEKQKLEFPFAASLGTGTITIQSDGIDKAKVRLNSEDILTKDDKKMLKDGGTITKTVVLLSANVLEVELDKLKEDKGKGKGKGKGGEAPSELTISIIGMSSEETQGEQTTDTTFTLKSYGKDGDPGGTGYNADIVYGE